MLVNKDEYYNYMSLVLYNWLNILYASVMFDTQSPDKILVKANSTEMTPFSKRLH